MQSFKSFLWKLAITATIWIIARFFPSFIQLLFNMEGGTILSSIIVLGLLLLAWYIAGSISKWKYPKTIATNLGILGTLNTVFPYQQAAAFSLAGMVFGILLSFSVFRKMVAKIKKDYDSRLSEMRDSLDRMIKIMSEKQ